MENFKAVALKAAKEAGKMLIKEYEKFNRAGVMLKTHHEIVTKADLKSEEIIIREIKKSFPGHGIVAEESGYANRAANHIWYIDPIDGTTNFSMHNPLWAVEVALARDGEILLGVIYAPMVNELYIAEAGKGATLNGKKIRVSETKSGKIINTFCHGRKATDIKKALAYYKKQKLSEFDCRQLGSAALEMAYIAAGRVESFVAPGINSWDVVPGVLLVREAGGKVTDFYSHDWQIGMNDIAASNGLVHQQILKAVRSK